jgi:hypothetical protein
MMPSLMEWVFRLAGCGPITSTANDSATDRVYFETHLVNYDHLSIRIAVSAAHSGACQSGAVTTRAVLGQNDVHHQVTKPVVPPTAKRLIRITHDPKQSKNKKDVEEFTNAKTPAGRFQVNFRLVR